MIKRYSRKELVDIWEEYNKYKIWLNIEVTASEGMDSLGILLGFQDKSPLTYKFPLSEISLCTNNRVALISPWMFTRPSDDIVTTSFVVAEPPEDVVVLTPPVVVSTLKEAVSVVLESTKLIVFFDM